MKKQFLTSLSLIIFCSLSGTTLAQQKVYFEQGCNFQVGRTSGNYTLFDPSKEAEKMVDEILKQFEIRSRPFILKESADVDNAQATIRGTERYLLYSAKFLRATTIDAQTLWAARGVFAHEIAHHALLQNLAEADPKKRKEMELAADVWAAQVLARMNATKEEALSATNTLKFSIEPAYYPTKGARLEGMETAYDEEIENRSIKDRDHFSARKTPFQIDPASYNRWSIVNRGAISSFYDNEKVMIDVNISPIYSNKKITVLICSNDPYMPIRTVKGVGAYMPYSNTMHVTWNFQLDNVTLNNAIRPNQIRVFVYDSENLPPIKGMAGSKIAFGSLGVAGLGIVGYSLKLRSDAKAHYDKNFVVTRNENDYESADKKYVNSQYILAAGGVLATAGTFLLINKLKRQKEAKKAICVVQPKWEIEPLLVSEGNFGAGIRIRF